MFRAGLLLIIRRYYSVYTAVHIPIDVYTEEYLLVMGTADGGTVVKVLC
jgi:hypothetical protein